MNATVAGGRWQRHRRDLLRLLPGLVLGAGLVVLLWTSVDMAQVAALMARAAWPPLMLALAAYALDFALRALRFWMLLNPRRVDAPPFLPTMAPFIASFGISDILPFRLGDVFRIHWFHSRQGVPVGNLIGAMIVERVLDLLAILAVAGAALWLVQAELSGSVAQTLGLGLGLAAAASLGLLFLPALADRMMSGVEARFPRPLVQRAAAALRTVTEALRAIGAPTRIAAMLVPSILLWLLESLVVLGAWFSLGGPLADWLKPLVAFGLSTLGTLVPALPGHFGSYDVAGVLSFRALGVSAETATATVLLAHLLLWLPTALFGVAWLLADRRAKPQPVSALSV